jgi:N-dimethylarginine dimethylaminohydrolase
VYPERQPESDHYGRWLEAHGYQVLRVPEETFFEGLGDLVSARDTVLIGYGIRSSRDAAKVAFKCFPDLKLKGILEIVDPVYFHLALAVALIDPETVIYYPPALSAESGELLRKSFRHVIEVDEHDARANCVCNNIPINSSIVLHDCSDGLRSTLEKLGYQVVKCGVSEFLKSGGSVRCLILRFQ